jgi:sigma-B regulation protein RsbU (phosphoserine phosphatase)
MFVTVFVGQYHPANKELVFANAGHSAVIFRPVNGRSRLLAADGAPLGIQERNLSKDHRLCLSEGDLLVVTTDGLYEARNPHSKSFGVQRLLKHVQRLSSQSALEISNTLLKAVGRFSGCEPQTDDQTILVVGCTGQSIQ